MIAYLARRLAEMMLVLAAVVVLAFAAGRLMPGDPIGAMLSDRAGDKELERRLREQYGLDAPLPEQFLLYVRGLAYGDFGFSYRFVGVPVIDVLGDSLKISPLLALGALGLAVPVGVAAGAFAALHRNRWGDTAVMAVVVAGMSIPNFAMATFLVYLFAARLGWLPVAGWGSPGQAVLPILVLALQPAAYVARLARTFMLEVLAQDYIRTARAKGLRERVVIWRHALRNTLVPLLTTIGIIFGTLLTSTFVIETIFNVPGLGRQAIQAIFARDYPVTIAVVLLFTFFYAGINLVVDLLYTVIDPRIRLDGGAR
jgi:ABC-type dipeptide/oligopeptide/nickel transport system permease component